MVFPLFLYLAHSRKHEEIGVRKAAKRLALRNFVDPQYVMLCFDWLAGFS